MKQEYEDIVKINNKTLYVSIPRKYVKGIEEGDRVKITIEKMEVK